VAKHFGVSIGVVYYWIEHRHLEARQLGPGSPYWITLSPESGARLQAWIANSNPITPTQPQNTVASGAI
jgi:hypothetical protein